MGRRGPAPTPTKLKLLRGETRPSRIDLQTPEPRDRRPVMPPDMDVPAQGVWRRVMREFGPTGVITAADHDALRCYCEAVARYEHAARLLATSGPLVRGARSGELVKNPLHQVVRDDADLVRAYARELGLTPSARNGLAGRAEVVDDPLRAWESSG